MICSICKNDEFIHPAPGREFRVCSKCFAMERHRVLWNILEKLNFENKRVLEIAPLTPYIFGGRLKEKDSSVVYMSSDKFKSGNPKDKRDSSFCDTFFDLAKMGEFVDNNSVDLFLMQHVLEEIPDYQKCLFNISKALSKDGVAYLEIPNNQTIGEHQRKDSDHFGNVWTFSQLKLIQELKASFSAVYVIDYSESGCTGNFFECHK